MSQGKHTEIIAPSMKGHAVKLFNMSPEPVDYYWVDTQGTPMNMGRCAAFHSTGTASFAGHQFFFAPTNYEQSKVILQHFTIDKHGIENLYYYDPITVDGNQQLTTENLSKLTMKQLEMYNKMLRNRKFAGEYKKTTGRDYMSLYPRKKPKHFLYPADHFGQEFWVTTKQTQFKEVPTKKLSKIREAALDRVLKDDDPVPFTEYRDQNELLNMTLKVISVRPRAYEINNFLSQSEVDHIISTAKKSNMQLSTTGSGNVHTESKTKTRTSKNTWVGRETDQVFDTLYRRAADLLRIDEALFRQRDSSERPDFPTNGAIAEQLQLVHYNKRQEYTAHHDFGYAPIDSPHQEARFATLLLYLNEPEAGGETEFPRWINGETSDGLLVTPKIGKAALFYSFLPDGNMDDLSHHSANPIEKGEKYLINLWVREPIF
uniref:Fe2OG dioxygenase domain-containing protein n=2 Tax=Chaetoceros debilis TaxID=122233 RepID=A0A7S3PZP9_9STRA